MYFNGLLLNNHALVGAVLLQRVALGHEMKNFIHQLLLAGLQEQQSYVPLIQVVVSWEGEGRARGETEGGDGQVTGVVARLQGAGQGQHEGSVVVM